MAGDDDRVARRRAPRSPRPSVRSRSCARSAVISMFAHHFMSAYWVSSSRPRPTRRAPRRTCDTRHLDPTPTDTERQQPGERQPEPASHHVDEHDERQPERDRNREQRGDETDGRHTHHPPAQSSRQRAVPLGPVDHAGLGELDSVAVGIDHERLPDRRCPPPASGRATSQPAPRNRATAASMSVTRNATCCPMSGGTFGVSIRWTCRPSPGVEPRAGERRSRDAAGAASRGRLGRTRATARCRRRSARRGGYRRRSHPSPYPAVAAPSTRGHIGSARSPSRAPLPRRRRFVHDSRTTRNDPACTREDAGLMGVPVWWTQRRFGLLLHASMATVPAWAPIGQYAEWYRAHRGGQRP